MAKKSEEKKQAPKKGNKETEEKKKYIAEEDINEVLVRILGYDILGSKNVFTGLTKIKGVSWAVSNAACIKLAIPKNKKISDLNKEDILKIENFLKTLPIPNFLKNRRSDQESGETKHYYGSDLEIKKEFDIKRLKEIRSYRGIRHATKLPVRGQRTRSHFRTKGKTMGVKRVKK